MDSATPQPPKPAAPPPPPPAAEAEPTDQELFLAQARQTVKPQCTFCHGLVDKGDKFCRHCGRELGKIPFSYTHAGVAMMFLVLGPLNLFWVWRSPVMSRNTKLFYTALYLGLTVLILIPVIQAVNSIVAVYSGAFSGNF